MTVKQIRLRRPDTCSGCGADLPIGTLATWDAAARTVTCQACGPVAKNATDASERPQGPGASAAAEGARRREARIARSRERWGPLGGLARYRTPQHEDAWTRGARGERKNAARLEKLLKGSGVILLHDRRIPGTRANIDHLAIGPGGITVIDSKYYEGKVRVVRRGGPLSTRTSHLMINGRDRTKVIDGAKRQVDAVTALLRADGRPRQLCRRKGPLDERSIELLARQLANVLPPA